MRGLATGGNDARSWAAVWAAARGRKIGGEGASEWAPTGSERERVGPCGKREREEAGWSGLAKGNGPGEMGQAVGGKREREWAEKEIRPDCKIRILMI